MTTKGTAQTSPAEKRRRASTKHIVTDERFAAILEEDFAIPAETILEALAGEPCLQAIAILEWASRQDDPAYALTSWSKKHRKGAHRPGQRRRDCGRTAPAVAAPRRRDDRPEDRPPTTAPRRDGCGESLRGIRCDPERLNRIAERLGV